MTVTHLSNDNAVPDNVLLAAAPLHEHRAVVLEAGEVLHPDSAMVWFPTTAVVRVEVGKPKVLAGWIDHTGAVNLLEYLYGSNDRTAYVVAVKGCAVAMPAAYIEVLMERSPAFGRAVVAWQHRSLGRSRGALADAVQGSAASRVARLLSELDAFHSHRPFSISQQEIARLLHLQRTTVCGVTTAFKTRGLIDYRRNRIEVIDPDGLKQVSGLNNLL